MPHDDRRGEEVVDGDIEKALNLRCVQIESQDAVRPRGADQIGH